VPVVDDNLRVLGVVSESDLLRKIEYAGHEEPRLFEGRRRRQDRAKAYAGTAAELMSSPPVVVRAGTPLAAAARLLDAEQVKRLPVVDEQGRLLGIVSRGDLLKVHLRPDDEIRQDVLAGVLGRVGAQPAPAVDAQVSDGVVTLTGRVDRWSVADLTVRATRQVAGVVEVVDRLEYDFDDTGASGPGIVYGVA
jgi:CBS-domain-containing membrane protein